MSFAERFRAARLRRAQLELTQFEYEWAATGIWGGAFACYLKQSPKDTERALRHHRYLKDRVERLGGTP